MIHDHRGHGASVKSPEDLGYMYEGGWKAMVEDVRVVNDWIHDQYPDLKVILYGHSMGSMVVRSFVKQYDDRISALLVSGCPVDNPAKGAGKALAWLFGQQKGWHFRPALLQKMSFGAYNKPFADEGWAAAWVCSDPETLKDYHADPLCQYVFTANGFYNLMGLMQGKILSFPETRHFRVSSISFSAPDMRVNVDGEIIPEKRVDARVLPGALMIRR